MLTERYNNNDLMESLTHDTINVVYVEYDFIGDVQFIDRDY